MQVTPADTSCAAIAAVPTTDGEINGTVLHFTPSSARNPAPQTQVGANYVTFPNTTTGSYTVVSDPPSANWSLAQACWHIGAGVPVSGSTWTLGSGETLIWDIGYTLGTAWAQTAGGDVYASGSLKSYIPPVSPRVFNDIGPGGYPGIVTYGTNYDFDTDSLSNGGTLVSSTNWLEDYFLKNREITLNTIVTTTDTKIELVSGR